ncbi:hypothetical protein LI951_00360 [Enterococcus sp. BWT-B8]|uniref:hypothetical protein n=1 Tax=Enterococcus sp. BWT-B8 TaxID=2885157 RepID=UPI001E369D3B|nr:hypothetical protein [Enterococcus sp. BWT-B8]MCB5950510.1 hypothetical protein [Enterococcus sp. BWT-B8]
MGLRKYNLAADKKFLVCLAERLSGVELPAKVDCIEFEENGLKRLRLNEMKTVKTAVGTYR